MFLQGPPIDLAWFETHNFWDHADLLPNGQCWLWKQSVASHGYGNTWDGTTVRLAHRVAWALWHREQIPEGMTVDHICRQRRCINPDHLRLLTNLENARDNGFATRTHCPLGHEYTEANTYVNPTTRSRQCRTCAKTRWNAA